MNKVFYKYCLLCLVVAAILLDAISCDKKVSRSPVEPEPSKSFIYVTSTPSGFTIFQDGRNTGRITPDSLSYLEPGDYEITLKREYYKDTSVTVSLNEDEKKQLQVYYLSNPSMYGKIFLDSEPEGAAIILNDSSINHVTPFTITGLLPGEYNIKYQLYNHRDAELTAVVQSSKKNNYYAELRDTSEWINYQTFNSGIQSNILNSIAIDQKSVKWIGSLDVGVIKYDGITFTNYSKSNSSIPDNRINCINVDNQNKIWVGTDLGLGIFDGNSWIVYTQRNSGLRSNIINSVNFDNQNTAWIGTSGGLAHFDGANWTVFNDSALRVWAMDSEFDNNNVLWIGTRENGIATLQNGTLTFLADSIYQYPSNRVYTVTKDNFGNMWFTHAADVGIRSGISYWDGNSFNSIFIGTSANVINHIAIDKNNVKWICTQDGFVRMDGLNVTEIFSQQNSLISSNRTTQSAIDKEGNIWIVTSAGGMNKYKPSK